METVFKIRNRDGTFREGGSGNEGQPLSSKDGKVWRAVGHVKSYFKQFFHWSATATERLMAAGDVDVVEYELVEKRIIPTEELIGD